MVDPQTRDAVSVMQWSTASIAVPGPVPTMAVLGVLMTKVEAALGKNLLRPCAVKCESWRRPEGFVGPSQNDFLCRITINVAPGGQVRPFRSWFQWQHPAWRWSTEPFPLALAIEEKA